ncbi:hypothetical protein [Aeromonas sp. QDB07]|uniref:hypothetical protein n=1 Tax=Aeromonas sp. QDB07 TaxID=2989838 RepID=UPI0022E03692|nr:hypothetical protein [Aeromonas sp. QDB07]
MLNVNVAEGRTVTASPVLFATVITGIAAWLLFAWVLLHDLVTTLALPSEAIRSFITVITIAVTLTLLLNRRVYVSEQRSVIVEDRLLGYLVHRRECAMNPLDSVVVTLFGQSWYAFNIIDATGSTPPTLITHSRIDSTLTMDLVVLLENAEQSTHEVISC